MKLRNKKTGEIGYFCFANWNDPVLIIMDNDGVQLAKYTSLAELSAEWEDAPEEPKDYWYINTILNRVDSNYMDSRDVEDDKAIGNYFLSREEAEKAVEKLKAWKRLKDKGLEVTEWCHGLLYLDKTIVGRFLYKFPIDNKEDIEKDLDLLFRGKE